MDADPAPPVRPSLAADDVEVRPKRARRSGEETRRIVLDAARQQIERAGAITLHVAGIARETGISQTLIYRHFGSRSHLIEETLLEMWRASVEEAREEAEALLARLGDLPAGSITAEQLAEVMLVPRAGSNPTVRQLRVQILAAAAELPDLRSRLAALQRELDDVTERMIVSGLAALGVQTPPVGVPMLRVLISALALGYAVDDLRGADAIDDAEVRRFWTVLFRQLLDA